ncbi:transmembrane protein 26-like [Orbicella faveolata]|uniref:transmembrane protein 26-like n=1 Tax=Orbicella faveolata TaxID=48498 RepID=UPI0009E5FF5B|nr:transmembrane protein 26-like [Orbicella faveolata]
METKLEEESSFKMENGIWHKLWNFRPIFYAVLTRVMFFIHGFMSVWLLAHCLDNTIYWVTILGIVLLFFEMVYTLLARKGQEYKYFWPSCFFYMSTMIPIIWIVELDLLEGRITNGNETTVTPIPSNSGCFGDMNSLTLARQICELGLIIGIIIGRWLLPRGEITRDQLSALLLGYVGTAADILELFEVLQDEVVQQEEQVTLAVLGVYTWSLLQFCLVTTATTGKNNQIRITNNKVSPDDVINRKISLHKYGKQEDLKERYIQRLQMKRRQTEMNVLRGKGYKGEKKEKKINPITTARGEVKEISRREMLLHGDIFGILTGIFMQDGPFLILRLLLIINYKVYSEMHIFFTCKNAIALSLLVYRLCILTCSGEDEEDIEHQEQESRLQNVQQAVLSENFQKAGAIQLAG